MKNALVPLFFPVAAFAVLALPFSAQAASNCMAYEPGVVTLQGKLRHSTVWTLEVDKPFCIEGRENDKTGMYSTVDKVAIVQLSSRKDGPEEKYPELANQEVQLTGTLHKLIDTKEQVAMMVSQIGAAGKN